MHDQGDVKLLQDPVAQELLRSKIPARLAYTWTDGSPRVVPIWFHWTGSSLVFGTPARAPKLKALRERPDVAITIDDNAYPHRVLLIRGIATIEMRDEVVEEYVKAAERYFGAEQSAQWIAQIKGTPMARIEVTPTWVAVLDFQTRFPSALTG